MRVATQLVSLMSLCGQFHGILSFQGLQYFQLKMLRSCLIYVTSEMIFVRQHCFCVLTFM